MLIWLDALSKLNIKPDSKYYNWLDKPYSVSHAMKKICKQLTLEIISQELAPAENNEAQLLHTSENNSLVRQVYLRGDGNAWSYGRVVAPNATYTKFKQQFDTLGGNLIGETLLYGNQNAKRSSFEYAEISRNTNLFALATINIKKPVTTQLYGRRSVFSINGFKLMVMEIYLPDIPAYPIESLCT